jgi:hypothetical protein
MDTEPLPELTPQLTALTDRLQPILDCVKEMGALEIRLNETKQKTASIQKRYDALASKIPHIKTDSDRLDGLNETAALLKEKMAMDPTVNGIFARAEELYSLAVEKLTALLNSPEGRVYEAMAKNIARGFPDKHLKRLQSACPNFHLN